MDDIDRFLEEDLNNEGDITSENLFNNEKAKANIIAKQNCILAGRGEVETIFKKTGAKTIFFKKDGEKVKNKTIIAEINGPIKSILKGERLALNFLGKMSGIATETNKLVKKCKKNNPKIQIAATRKTTPGFRKYEKKAVKIGDGETHRYGLFDAVMIKDNHIKSIGSVKKAIKKIKQNVKNKTIEIEVENEKDAITAAEMKVDVIMLDNMLPKEVEKIAKKIKKIDKNILIEISGGITPENIIEYSPYADRISLGYLTHSTKSKDFSLEII